MGEGDERAVVALKVRQFLKVVGGLVGSIFAVFITVVDPFKLNGFSVFAGVVRIDDIVRLVLSFRTIIAAIVEQPKS